MAPALHSTGSVGAHTVASGQDRWERVRCMQSDPRRYASTERPSGYEGYEGGTKGGVRGLAMRVACLMVLAGLAQPQQGGIASDHFNQLLHLQHTQIATPRSTQNVHFSARQHPVGKWMCAFAEDFPGQVEGTEEDTGATASQRKAYDSHASHDFSKKVSEANENFSIVRDQYLKNIKDDADSRTLLESVPVYHIRPQLRDSCVPQAALRALPCLALPAQSVRAQAMRTCDVKDREGLRRTRKQAKQGWGRLPRGRLGSGVWDGAAGHPAWSSSRPGPEWPKIPVCRDFPPLGVRPVETQGVQKLRTTIPDSVVTFPPRFGTPSTRKLRFFFCLRPEPGIPPSAQGCLGSKRPQKPVFCGFPPLGVGSARTQDVDELCNFGEKRLGRTGFPPKKKGP